MVFCHKPPWPTVDGGTVATAQMAEGLAARGVEVKVLALATPKHPGGGSPPESIEVETVSVDTRPRVIPALLNLMRREPYQLQRFFSRQALGTLKECLRDFRPDIVQLDGVGVLPYFGGLRAVFDGLVVYRAHNIEHQLIRDRVSGVVRSPVSWWLTLQAARLEKREAAACREVDGVVAISDRVADWCRIQARGPVTVIGVCIAASAGRPRGATAQDLVHLGAMDWPPNREGVAWFVREVWPEIKRRHPELEFHIAGRQSGQFGNEIKVPGVVVDGEVDSAVDYLGGHGLMVVPLLSGSGIRVKVVEGMALGKGIIATRIAAEGLGVEEGRHLLIAEDPGQWIETIDRCLSNPGLVASLGAEAWSFAQKEFSPRRLSKDLEYFYTALTK